MLSVFTNWRLNRLYSALAKLDLPCRPRREWVDKRGVLRISADPAETSDIAYVIVHGGLSEKAVRLLLRQNEWDLWRLVWQRRRKHTAKAVQ